ncbi:sodium-dependent transporter [candidate division KSB1 bacterium]|nr:sodium-dependent transporter [candidate division KSB1 bacterium]
MPNRQLFSSNLTTVITMIGVSVGLGNVWRFPYMMGKYGGSAFLIMYLIFTVLFAIPALMAEWALGRETRKGPIGAFSAAFGSGLGKPIGYLLILTVLVADSYYLVVIANVIFTTYFSIAHGFTETNMGLFQTQLGNGVLQYVIAVATLVACLVVIYRGLNKGIESISKIFVPFFGVVIIYLVINAFLLEGAPEKFAAFLNPDFSVIKAEQVFAALGQTFFSLGLGGTFLVIYGSYMQREQNLPRAAIATAFGDVGAAVLASLFIVPTVLVFGLDMSQGPTLIFSTLPELFNVMPAGRLLGSAFLLSLCMVAFLSAVAALEVAVGGLTDILKTSRTKIILALGGLELILMLPSSLYPKLIGILDLVFGSGMQVFGSALAVLGVVWGLGKIKTLNQIFGNAKENLANIYFVWIRWVVPLSLLFILISYIYTSLK